MTVDDHTKHRIRHLDPQRVADWLGLESHRTRHKYACPWCGPTGDGSGDNLHVNSPGDYDPDGRKCAAKCFACGTACGDTIAFAQKTLDCGFVDAVAWLARHTGIEFDADDHDRSRDLSPNQHAGTADHESESRDVENFGDTPPQRLTDWLLPRMPFDTFRRVVDAYERRLRDSTRRPSLALAYTIMADIWGRMDLESTGAAYLASRDIPAAVAGRAGVRSTSRETWARLAGDYPPEVLEFIGFNRQFRRSNPSFDHVLWFPYFDQDGQLSTLRWREANDAGQMMGLATSSADERFDLELDSPHRPAEFYLAPSAIDGADSQKRSIWLVEGELDALSLWAAGRPAIAAPGATWVDSKWWHTLRRAPSVVIAGDGDAPGKKFTQLAKDRAQDALGKVWAETRCGRAHWTPGNDANDLLGEGRLETAIRTLESTWGIDQNRRPETARPAAI